ncbi:hypothetical protein [Dysgonomonas sp. 511]|uniref:hypothetical protein n=1 Tax=Dysgonomonas sp. 511 TaxID=2302930 RepID=UPI0013D2E70C|nr:hypothetical protein [Dysgonomonas sp. 511]NDV77858.1 hypothetical protein [Dysgonomonas sp. 511]
METKTINLTVKGSSVNHGEVDIDLSISLIGETPLWRVEIICLTDGFHFGEQTSGVRENGEKVANSELNGNNKIVLYGKKSLSKLGSNFLVVYKNGLAENKKDRFILSFWGVDLPSLMAK